MTSRLSIIVPTMNRVEFINRALHYYAQRKFQGTLLFADSSTGPHKAMMADVIDGFRDRLSIVYTHLPQEQYPGVAECVAEVMAKVQTPYVVLTPDDDLQVVRTLTIAADFLDANPGFTAAMGHRFNLRLGQVVPWGTVERIEHVPYPPMDSPQAVERAMQYAHRAVAPLYGVMRTSVFQRIYSFVHTINLPYFSEEFLPSVLLVALGRFHILPLMGPVPQIDGSGGIWVRNTPFSLISDPRWPANCALLCQELARAFEESDGLAPADAQRQATIIVWHHLRLLLNERFAGYAQPDVVSPVPEPVNQIETLQGNGDFQDIAAFLSTPLPLDIPQRPWVGDEPDTGEIGAVLAAGDAVQALALAGRLWDDNPGAPAIALAAGNAARRAGRFHDAVAWFRLALAACPADPIPALLGLGWTFAEQSRRDEAAGILRQLRDSSPSAGDDIEKLAAFLETAP